MVNAFGLACTVRGCGLPLEPGSRALACARGHSYDVAHSGYVNLLQPQDRRSRAAGDSKTAVEARARLLAAGIGRALLEHVVHRAATLDLGADSLVVDLGSGSGDALGWLSERRTIAGVGIDLSAAAAEHAARRFRTVTWVVANADRRLPLLDQCVTLALSVHARRNPGECARVMAPGRFLLTAVPAEDDLIELRELVHGQRIERDRAEALLAEHQPYFTLVERSVVREQRRLERDSLLGLLHTTYRGARSSAGERIRALQTLDVTLASDLLLFTRR